MKLDSHLIISNQNLLIQMEQKRW